MAAEHEPEASLNVHRGDFLLFVTSLAVAATPAFGQDVAPAVGVADNGTHSAASIPDFSGIWSYPYCCGFEPPLSDPAR
jgi:hypothetical protein